MRFEDTLKAANDFKSELALLIKKHKVTIVEHDNYDSEENFKGNTYYLEFDKALWGESIEDIFAEVINLSKNDVSLE